MSRRDEEPVSIAEFGSRAAAEQAWLKLTDAGFAAAVVSDSPPWGTAVHRVQVERRHAVAALNSLNDS